MSKMIRSSDNLVSLIDEYGFLPFFRNEIQGFSVEEMTAPELWFSSTEEGPWEWKGPVIRTGSCIYGKLFRNKAGFVSLKWAPDFINYRRNGYDFDAGIDEGIYHLKDTTLYSEIASNGPILTDRLKLNTGYASKGKNGYEGSMTRLQMHGYIIVSDFVFQRDKKGNEYGWGVAEYATPEKIFGENWLKIAYSKEPEKSFELMYHHLRKLFPSTDEKSILKILSR